MHLTTLLEMAAEGFGDRTAFGSRHGGGLTYAALLDRAQRTGAWAATRGVGQLGLVDVNSDVVPALLFGSGYAGLPLRAHQLPPGRRAAPQPSLPARRRP